MCEIIIIVFLRLKHTIMLKTLRVITVHNKQYKKFTLLFQTLNFLLFNLHFLTKCSQLTKKFSLCYHFKWIPQILVSLFLYFGSLIYIHSNTFVSIFHRIMVCCFFCPSFQKSTSFCGSHRRKITCKWKPWTCPFKLYVADM